MAKKTWKPTLASDRLTRTERLRLLRERADAVAGVIPRMFDGGYWGMPDTSWLEDRFEHIRACFAEFAAGSSADDLVDACESLRGEAKAHGLLRKGSLARYWVLWVAAEAEEIRKASSEMGYAVDYDF